MVRDLNINIFNLVTINRALGSNEMGSFIKDMFKVYQENNCLDLFINYYGNYFGADYLVEQNASSMAMAKMFLYAYTLEEKNRKSFYSLMNNDLRSGDPEKIGRYLSIFGQIYILLKKNYLKSYSGNVYRATYFKDELINSLEKGKKLINASLWSSSKNITVAKKFLFNYQEKNVLLHTNIKAGNNIDIHLENISRYPKEEEILFLPYCVFEVKSFKKVKEKFNEKEKEYYDLELIYSEEENKKNKLGDIKVKDISYFMIQSSK